MKVSSSFHHSPVSGFKFGSYPIGKPSMYVHVYYIDGLLIDTGHSNMENEIFSKLKDLDVQQMFLTHHHEDHTANTNILQKHFTCPVYSSKLCAGIMKSPPKISFAQWLTWGQPQAIDHIKIKEDSLVTPHYTFDIIPIPGHAIDMVCLHEKNEGWLFSADLYVYHYIKYFMRAESVAQQIESLKKVIKLDFDILYCAHNPQFENAKECLKKKLQFLEDFYGNVSQVYHKGHSAKAIFKTLKLKENWQVKILSGGELSTLNMVRSIIRDEVNKLES